MSPHTLPAENILVVPQKVKACNSVIPLLVIYLMKTYVHIKTGTQMFIAALFILAKKQRQPKCPSTSQCINKKQYNDTMECYLEIKRNEVPDVKTTH